MEGLYVQVFDPQLFELLVHVGCRLGLGPGG